MAHSNPSFRSDHNYNSARLLEVRNFIVSLEEDKAAAEEAKKHVVEEWDEQITNLNDQIKEAKKAQAALLRAQNGISRAHGLDDVAPVGRKKKENEGRYKLIRPEWDPPHFFQCKIGNDDEWKFMDQIAAETPAKAAKIYNALPKVKRSEPFTNKEFWCVKHSEFLTELFQTMADHCVRGFQVIVEPKPRCQLPRKPGCMRGPMRPNVRHRYRDVFAAQSAGNDTLESRSSNSSSRSSSTTSRSRRPPTPPPTPSQSPPRSPTQSPPPPPPQSSQNGPITSTQNPDNARPTIATPPFSPMRPENDDNLPNLDINVPDFSTDFDPYTSYISVSSYTPSQW